MLFVTRPLPSLTVGLAFFGLVLAGCDGGGTGSGGGQTTTNDSGDGKYHPTPNGAHVGEKEACDALVKKQEKQLLALHCVGTGQTCPSFLRAQFQTPCMEYDQGSVDGCIEYYGQQSTCDSLKSAIDECVVTPYPGTEPAGCPIPDGGTGGGGTGGTGGTTTSSGGTGGAGGTGGTTTSSGGTGGTTGSGGTMTGMGGAMSGSAVSSGSGM